MEFKMIVLGKNKQVNAPKSTFYKFLGYIANHPNDVSIVFENNETSGAWGSEGRIHFYSETARQTFDPEFKFTKGVGNTLYRLNCNDLIEKMIKLGFQIGKNQNSTAIRQNIPSTYLADYDLGSKL